MRARLDMFIHAPLWVPAAVPPKPVAWLLATLQRSDAACRRCCSHLSARGGFYNADQFFMFNRAAAPALASFAARINSYPEEGRSDNDKTPEWQLVSHLWAEAVEVRLLNLSAGDQLVSFDSWRFMASLAALRGVELSTHCASLNGCIEAPLHYTYTKG